ncbi:hypothetical protein Pelo_5031 [Pelomyxa schiedti]|nr:hypothetical protein Pelo_5031 [Pelomyxa schiedti]
MFGEPPSRLHGGSLDCSLCTFKFVVGGCDVHDGKHWQAIVILSTDSATRCSLLSYGYRVMAIPQLARLASSTSVFIVFFTIPKVCFFERDLPQHDDEPTPNEQQQARDGAPVRSHVLPEHRGAPHERHHEAHGAPHAHRRADAAVARGHDAQHRARRRDAGAHEAPPRQRHVDARDGPHQERRGAHGEAVVHVEDEGVDVGADDRRTLVEDGEGAVQHDAEGHAHVALCQRDWLELELQLQLTPLLRLMAVPLRFSFSEP